MRRGTSRIIHGTLLLTILVGSLAGPVVAGSAAPQLAHPLDETLLLLANAELWATGGGDPVEALNRGPGLSSPSAPRAASARQIQVSINAVKEVIAMKRAAYEQSTAMLEGNVSPEALQAHDEKFLREMDQLDTALEELRKEWRRQKRFLPKLVKPFKQAGSWFWHQIGPVGRQILRAVGDDLVQMVVTGDPVSGRVIKMLILKHARTVGREKAKEVLVRVFLRDGSGMADDEATTAESEGEGEAGEEMTADQFWATVYADLQSQRLHCNQEGLRDYKECLMTDAEPADSWESALERCGAHREYLRPFPERAVLEDPEHFFRDNDNYFTLTYDLGSGAVTGRYDVFFLDYGPASPNDPDAIPCQVTMTYNFTGRISAADCSLIGSGVQTVAIDEAYECHWWESSVGSEEKPLQARIDNGKISGSAAGTSFALDLVEHAGQ